MYYIHTADRLMRTARWLEKLEGGIEVSNAFFYNTYDIYFCSFFHNYACFFLHVQYLKKVIIDDHLGICAELEEDMARLIYTYECEVKDL